MARSPDAVFAALADPRHPAGRSRSVVAVEVAGPVRLGSRFRLQVQSGSRRFWHDGEVIAHEPPRVIGYEVWTRRRTLGTRSTYTLAPAGGGCEVHAVFEVQAPRFLRGRFERALREHLDEVLGRLPADAG